MVAGLLSDCVPLVWVEIIGFCNMLDRLGLSEVEADRCVDPWTGVTDCTLDCGIINDCVLLESVLESEMLGRGLAKIMLDEDALGFGVPDERIIDEDVPERIIFDTCVLGEAWLDETLVERPPVVTD